MIHIKSPNLQIHNRIHALHQRRSQNKEPVIMKHNLNTEDAPKSYMI